MPLIVMCGFPSSGKSTRSREIMDFFKLKTPDCNVHVINDETLGLQKSIYSNSQSEKLARGELLSAVQRNLTKNDIVIVDALNYIKGFRYQLYCTSREVGTSQCTVFCMISQDEALERNRKMGKNAYDEKTFNELILRFEEPIYNNRWDKPLLTVFSGDSTPCNEIYCALFGGKSLKPTLATMPKQTTPTDYLYELDRITQKIISELNGMQSDGLSVNIMGKIVNLARKFTLLELNRIRRKFITLHKMNTLNSNDIGPLFLEYLNVCVN